VMAGASTQQSPWAGTSAVEAGESLARILVVVLAVVPLLALFRPVRAAVVGLLPLMLTYGAATERQVPWVAYAALVLAAMVASRDRPVQRDAGGLGAISFAIRTASIWAVCSTGVASETAPPPTCPIARVARRT
jgi:hypothetical protein